MTRWIDFKGPAQKKPGKWEKYLKILHIVAIPVLLISAILLVYFILNSPPENDKSPGEDMKESQSPFFAPGAVYYVKKDMAGEEQEFIAGLLKNLKMSKEAVENGLKSLNWNKISWEREGAKQYFFHKREDGTIYTFVKPGKPSSVGEKLRKHTVEIDLRHGEKQDPTTTWMKFIVERQVNQPGGGSFSIELSKRSAFYPSKFEKTVGKLNDITDEYVEALQNIVWRNRNTTRYNLKTLRLEFIPADSTNLQNETIFLKDKLTTEANETGFERFVLKNRTEFEKEIERVLTRFFLPEKGPVEIYHDGEKISTPTYNLDDAGEKINLLLGGIDINNFQEWQRLLKKSGIKINFHRLDEYIKEKKEKLPKIPIVPVDESELERSIKVIAAGIYFFGVSFIYLLLWYYFNLKIRSNLPGEDVESKPIDQEQKEIQSEEIDRVEQAVDADTYVRLLDAKQITEPAPIIVEQQEPKPETVPETTITEPEKEEETTEPPGEEPMKFHTIELKKMQLKKIDGLLKELHQRAIENFTDTKEEITNINQMVSDIKPNLSKQLEFLKEHFSSLEGRLEEITERIQESISNKKKSKDDKFDFSEFAAQLVNSSKKNDLLLEQLHKSIESITEDSQNESKMYQMLAYINKETNLTVKKDNVLDIIDKVSNESKISKEYRSCAVNLYEDLIHLEENYQDTWYWKLLADQLFNKLKENIDLFSLKNENAKTIYDSYFRKEIPLRDIDNEHIRKIIENLHWFQFWNGLIRLSDFFNAYFDDDMAEINLVLGYYAKKVKIILSKLGCEIIHIKPLTVISSDDSRKKEMERIDQAYIKEFILKNLVKSNNQRLKDAAANIPADHEIVVYVERLGLIDKLAEKPVSISNIRFGAYNGTFLESYISSPDR